MEINVLIHAILNFIRENDQFIREPSHFIRGKNPYIRERFPYICISLFPITKSDFSMRVLFETLPFFIISDFIS